MGKRLSVPDLLERQRNKLGESVIRFVQRIEHEADGRLIRFGETAYRRVIKRKGSLPRRVLPAVAKVLSRPIEELEQRPLMRRPAVS